MSLVFTSFTGGGMTAPVAAPTGAGNSAVASATAGATTPAFALTLVQSMEGNIVKEAAGSLIGNVAVLLQGLLAGTSPAGKESAEAEGTEAGKLLEKLGAELEQLDEDIQKDPALLAALQGWLLQVAALLNGNSTSGPTEALAEGAAGAEGLSPLARQPETLRFAVQDELHNLVSMIQNASAAGNEEAAVKGMAMLGQFSTLLAEVAVPEAKEKTTALKAGSIQAMPENQAGKNTAKTAEPGVRLVPDKGAQPAVEGKQAAALTMPAQQPAGDSGEDRVSASVMKSAVPALNAETVEEMAPDTVKASADPSDVITAGQLSLRDGMTAPQKTELQRVPVHRFAEEMDTFIKGNLQIVQKGGVAEATITLFPDNLGQVDVKITMQAGTIVAQFVTEHTVAKDMLEQQMNQLRSALVSQGLQVEKLEVSQSNSSSLFSQFAGQQGRGTGSGAQQDRRSRERGDEQSDALLAAELNGEWKDWVANTRMDQREGGSGFSAKV
ncbi:flagellar hook-length control protein FliK [Paenibacillus tepidiphilus]|uniref:flagellar hook-length control protein FliK n=1 Tax=Paenibacillus tepidiphilus TaxID=2608683 RepID=UPI0012388F36|nr:flagellar hook-length control protein FliK [Paenibacillus tepidiphilus]